MALVAQTNGRVRLACSRARELEAAGGMGGLRGKRGCAREREAIPGAPGGGGVHGVRTPLGNGTWL